jgi:hypothetical protein
MTRLVGGADYGFLGVPETAAKRLGRLAAPLPMAKGVEVPTGLGGRCPTLREPCPRWELNPRWVVSLGGGQL